MIAPGRASRGPLSRKGFLEFFAGIGLVREGLSREGWTCAYANDIAPPKRKLYVARFGDSDFHLGDVRQTEAVASLVPSGAALATASFPCTDLSVAGHYRGLEGEHSSTFFAFSDVLQALPARPPMVLLENVCGLLSSHAGGDFRAVAQRLAALGYCVDAVVIDARHFLPQSRPRVFVLALHHEWVDRCDVVRSAGASRDQWRLAIEAGAHIRPSRLIRLMASTDLVHGWMATPLPALPTCSRSLRELIDLDDHQDWWTEPEVRKHYEMMSDSHRARVDGMLEQHACVHVGTIFRRKRDGRTRAETRFDGIAGCLRVPSGGSARQIVIAADRGQLRMRWMSPREYARLQGAPDYPLVGTPNQQMAGFGDAVCVPVIAWLDQHALTPWFEQVLGYG